MEHEKESANPYNTTVIFDRRISQRSTDSVMRFEFGGYIHQTHDWNSYGFKIKSKSEINISEGDSFVIRGVGYGKREMVPVTIRAEIMRKDKHDVSVRFLQNKKRDRLAFENFVHRSKCAA